MSSWLEICHVVGVTPLRGSGRAPEVLILCEQIRSWRFYGHFRTDAASPARLPQVGARTPVLGNDGHDLAAAWRTIMEIGDREALDATVADAFPGATVDVENGYDTVLGRDGGTLSVGQKQRLSIARGLARNTPILILDEPTAALDPETERALIAALNVAKGVRIVFVIAHRLSTIASADWILFMDDGRLVEQGPHGELAAKPDGAYRRFLDLQG